MSLSQHPDDSSQEWPYKELVIQEMMNSIAQIQRRFQAEGNDEERRWMISRTDNPKVKAILEDSTVVMLHVIDAVGHLEPVNGITISKQYDIPRGSVSKITRKLKEQGVIETGSLPDNKKEVLFRLTPLGREIFDLHEALHREIVGNTKRFMHKYSLPELKFLASSMKDTLTTSFVEIEKGSGDTAEEGASGSSLNSLQETGSMGDIIGMLQQLDERDLQKAKEMIKVVFFD